MKYKRIKPPQVGSCDGCCFNNMPINTTVCHRPSHMESCCKNLQHISIFVKLCNINNNIKIL